MTEEKKYYNYIWFIKDTNEVFYVGKGSGKRYKQIRHRNKFFLDIYNSHKCEVKIIKNNLTEKEAFENEIELIKYYRNNTNYRLTNQTDGGEGASGLIVSDETKKKVSIMFKNMWKDTEFRNRIIEARHSLNSTYQSKEFKDKISKLVKGENNPNYNNHWTDEQKIKLSELRKKNGLSAGILNVKATKIICLETGETFNLISDAMKKYNVKSEGCFSVALKYETKTAANLHWKKYDIKYEDSEYRLKELIRILSISRRNPYIRLEDKFIFQKQKDLLEYLNITIGKLNTLRNKNEIIVINNKTYMPISLYINSPLY